jgi:hypothetical protein
MLQISAKKSLVSLSNFLFLLPEQKTQIEDFLTIFLPHPSSQSLSFLLAASVTSSSFLAT